MARLTPAKSRKQRGMVRGQNVRDPGGLAELTAQSYDKARDRQLVGWGPDSRLREWTFGLGHDLIAAKVKMHDIVDSRWQDVGIRGARVNPTDPKGRG